MPDSDPSTFHSPKTLRRLGLQGHLGVLFAAFIALTGLILAMAGYFMVVGTTDAAVKARIEDLTSIVRSEIINTVNHQVRPMLSGLARGVLPRCAMREERLSFLPLLTSLQQSNPVIDGFHAFYADGEYFMVRRLHGNDDRLTYDAPPTSAFMVESLDRDTGTPRHQLLFYDTDMRLLLQRPGPAAGILDPAALPWFRHPPGDTGQSETEPFLIAPGLPAVLFAEKSFNGTLMGVDISLQEFSELLHRELPTPGARLAVLRPDGTPLVSAYGLLTEFNAVPRLRGIDDLAPITRAAMRAYTAGEKGTGLELKEGGRKWMVSLEEFPFSGHVTAVMALAVPEDDLLAGGRRFLLDTGLITAGILLLCGPFIWLTARRISLPLRLLASQAESMQGFLSEESAARSRVSEIDSLAKSMRHLQRNIRKMLNITQTINSERDFHALLQRVLQEIIAIAEVDGGLLALLDEKQKVILDQGAVCWILEGKKMPQQFLGHLIEPNMKLAGYRALAQDVSVRDTVTREDERRFLAHLAPAFRDPDVVALDLICVPLHDRMNEQLGILVLYRTVKPGKDGFRDGETGFLEALAAAAAVALENQSLLDGQNNLRDALIHILAGAIDAKSPYTGGHCRQVPIIFQMLLEAACDAREGPFKDFFLDPDAWEEAKLAGWLHDCGKVTTPEYVMDKATKLETIYDRIHEIRTRFEVLKRDAEIAYLNSQLQGADPQSARQKLDEQLRALDDDFTFVASCNSGSEYMPDEDIRRLTAIGARTWTRTLDKRLGVSRGERAHMDLFGEPKTPAQETLLRDGPEHIIPRGEKDMLPPDNPWGFKLTPPRALYNRGELYNLSIRRGTLTEEERYKINDHISQTIIMLEAMPLPKHLRKVPSIAGAHHETMDGRGYPRKLTREQMSWEARMMAVADIFEALTAWDRPYKSVKTLREVIVLMEELKNTSHIDPDVYELFIKADIPRRYAAQYLHPEQNNL